MLPNIPVDVMNDYVEVSDNLFPSIFRHLIWLQAHPKSKQYFIKAFLMYNDIADLLGNVHTSGFVSNNGWKKPGTSQANLEPSQAPPLMQASTATSFAIDPLLEAISLEMQSTQGVNSEEVVC